MTPNPNKFVPSSARKFREHNADVTVFQLEGHTPEYPKTLTIKRTLPEPSRRHLGTQKYLFNFNFGTNVGTESEPKRAPVIVKVETSMPLGASQDAIVEVLANASMLFDRSAPIVPGRPSQMHQTADFLKSGLLPDYADGEFDAAEVIAEVNSVPSEPS